MGKGYEWGHKPPTDPQATVWFHITTDSTWKTRIPAQLEQSCIKLCGPVSWETADKLLREMKASFETLNIEHFELTCSDD